MINIFQKTGNTCVLVGRTLEGNRTMQERSITPYFFIRDSEGEYKDLFGTRLRKIETVNSWDVRNERENYKKTWESDVLFTDRIMIDTIEKFDEEPIRKMYYDIENDDCLDITNAPKPITCICIYDNYKKKKYGFVWREDLEEKTIKTEEKNVYYFNDEKKMLRKFIKFICDFDFDLFAGWHNEGFDFPYIFNRCIRLEIKDIHWISMKGNVTCIKRNNNWESNIKGRYNFDLLRGYRTDLTFHQLDSYKLDDIAFEELGEKKIKFQESHGQLWRNDIEKLLKYCFKDVMLCVRLDDKRSIIRHYDIKRRLVGCQWKDLFNATRFHDILFLREARNQGVILPKKERNEKVKFKGAFVDDPKPGLKKDIVVLDLKSLYPEIIKTWNLSQETIKETGNIKVNGLIIDEEKVGICPTICSRLLKQRDEFKRERKKAEEKHGRDSIEYKSLDAQQYALKVMVNSLYGALGNPYFRMFNNKIAATIAKIAKDVILYSKKVAEEMGIEVVYGDTDSIFIKVSEHIQGYDNIEKASIALAGEITKSYDSFVKKFGIIKPHSLLMQYETLFERMFFGIKESGKSVKKRYAGYIVYRNSKGEWVKKFKAKGFEIKRSDSAKIERKTFKEIYRMILDEKGKKDILDYVNEIKKNMKEGKYKWGEIAIRRGIKKFDHKDIYTEAIKYSNKHLGTKFTPGCRIKMLFVRSMPEGYPFPEKGTIAFDYDRQLPEGIKVDWENIFRRLFDTKLERVFQAMGWNEDENQMRLFE